MRLIAILLLTSLAGCAAGPPPAPIESTREVAAEPAAALARAADALQQVGFRVEPVGGSGVRGTMRAGARQDWASCGRLMINDYDSIARRRDWAEPRARRARVTVTTAPAASGARVEARGEFSATYRDRFKNLPVEAGCESTGAVERLVLDAAAG